MLEQYCIILDQYHSTLPGPYIVLYCALFASEVPVMGASVWQIGHTYAFTWAIVI